MKNYLAIFVCFLVMNSFSLVKVLSSSNNLKENSSVLKKNFKMDSNIINNFFEEKMFTQNKEIKGNCLVKIPYGNENKERFYDFKNFPQISVQNIQFNLCGDVFGNESCDSLDKTGMIVSKSTCSSYSNESKYLKKWKLLENGEILVEFPEGEICSKPGEIELNYRVTALLKCSKRKGYFVEQLKGFDTCNPNILISSHKLCDYKTYISWIDSLQINKSILSLIIISIGILLCILGAKLRDFSAYTLLFISLNLMCLTLVQFELEFQFIYYASISGILSLFVLGFSNFQQHIISYSTGFIMGITTFCGAIYLSNYTSPIYLFILIIAISLLLNYIGDKSSFIQLLICTSIVGSLCIVRGLSILIDNFPDEQYLVKLYSNEEFSSMTNLLNNVFEANTIMFCIFGSVGLVVQYLFKSKYECEHDLSNGEYKIDKYGNDTQNESNILKRLWL